MAKRTRKEIDIELNAHSEQLKANLNKASQSVKGFGRNVKTSTHSASTGFKGIGASAGMLPGPIGRVSMAFKGLNASLGIIAIVVLALAAAFKAVKTYLTGSVEGEKVMNKITSTLAAVMGVLKDIVMDVGKAIINAFTNPKKAISDLWKVIKQNFVNRFEGLKDFMIGFVTMMINGGKAIGNAILGIFSPKAKAKSKEYFDKMKQNALDVAKSLVKMNTGIDTSKIKKGNKYTEQLKKNMSNVAKLTELKNKRDKMSITYDEKKAKLIREYNELYRKASDSSVAAGERHKAAITAQEKLNKLKFLENTYGNTQYQIIKMENDMGVSNTAELKKQHDIQAKINADFAAMITMEKRLDSSRNKSTKDIIKLRKKAGQPLNDANDKMQEQVNYVDDANTELKDMGNITDRNTEKSKDLAKSVEPLAWDIGNVGFALASVGDQLLSNTIVDFVDGISSAFVNLLDNKNSLKDFFKSFIRYLEGVIIKLTVTLLLAIAVSALLGGSNLAGSLGMTNGAGLMKNAFGFFGKMSGFKVPKMGGGGIVTQPTLAMVGEGGQSEAVIPLSRFNNFSGNGKVVFQIEGDKLVGVLNNYDNQINNF